MQLNPSASNALKESQIHHIFQGLNEHKLLSHKLQKWQSAVILKAIFRQLLKSLNITMTEIRSFGPWNYGALKTLIRAIRKYSWKIEKLESF